MKKIAMLLIALMVISVGLLSGCFETTTSDVIGTWEESYYGDIWKFYKNDTLLITIDNYTETYTWDMDYRYIYLISTDTIKFRYEMLNDDNTLLLESSSESFTLKRQ